jgi:exosome complex component RRP4
VGQNGVIVISGPPEGVVMAVKAINLVEQEAHTPDLQQKIQSLLSVQGNIESGESDGKAE